MSKAESQQEENQNGSKSNKPEKIKKQDKNKKPNVFVRMGRKLKETFGELKRVTWPSFGKALKATGVVLGIVVVFLVVVTGVNYGFSRLLELLTSMGGE